MDALYEIDENTKKNLLNDCTFSCVYAYLYHIFMCVCISIPMEALEFNSALLLLCYIRSYLILLQLFLTGAQP